MRDAECVKGWLPECTTTIYILEVLCESQCMIEWWLKFFPALRIFNDFLIKKRERDSHILGSYVGTTTLDCDTNNRHFPVIWHLLTIT